MENEIKFMNQDLEKIERIVEKKTKDYEEEIYLNPSFSLLYHLSNHRENIISWFPFEEGKVILELGSECGAITQYLSSKASQVIAVEENNRKNVINSLRSKGKKIDILEYTEDEFLTVFSQKVDYIIAIGYLDRSTKKSEILDKAYQLLNKNGKIIIAGYNTLGVKFISGAKNFYTNQSFTNGGQTTCTKRELMDLMENSKFKSVEVYYPYPDHLYTENLYSDLYLPKIGDLHNNIRNFDNDRVAYFDETKMFNYSINEGIFQEMSNSFLMIGSKEIVKKEQTIYVKFSKERQPQYQIQTSILENDGGRRVLKENASHSEEHLKGVYNFYNALDKENLKVRNINYCKADYQEGKLYFEYIEGRTLESIINEAVDKKDIKKVYAAIDTLQYVVATGEKEKFTYTDKFNEVFGEGASLLFTNDEAMHKPNIDLITDNIIVNDMINIIDYEWIFEFPVPIAFILFRSLFHSNAISRLDKKERDEIYRYCNVQTESIPEYLKMEYHFQEYISCSTYKLRPCLEKMNYHTINIEEDYVTKVINKIKCIAYDANSTEVYTLNRSIYYTNSFTEELELKDNIEKIEVIVADKNCIINLRLTAKTKHGEEEISFATNAKFKKEKTYFFDEKAVISFKNNNYQMVKIEVYYFYLNEGSVQSIIDLNIANQKLEKELYRINTSFGVTMLKKLRIMK